MSINLLYASRSVPVPSSAWMSVQAAACQCSVCLSFSFYFQTSTSAASLLTFADRASASTHRETLNASALKVMRVASWWWKTAWVSPVRDQATPAHANNMYSGVCSSGRTLWTEPRRHLHVFFYIVATPGVSVPCYSNGLLYLCNHCKSTKSLQKDVSIRPKWFSAASCRNGTC